jgi:hypothetical protein
LAENHARACSVGALDTLTATPDGLPKDLTPTEFHKD